MDIPNPFDRVSRSTFLYSALIVSFAWLLIGANLGGYESTRLQNEVLCLSCLGLDPAAEDFEGFWVEHPDTGKVPKHPDWLEDELDGKKAVFIFTWDYGCKACDVQWEDMKDAGLVSGDKSDPTLEKYTDDLVLLCLRSSDEEDKRGSEAKDIYDPNMDTGPGDPMSLFFTLEEDTDDPIYWWGTEGKMKAGDVETVIEAAIAK